MYDSKFNTYLDRDGLIRALHFVARCLSAAAGIGKDGAGADRSLISDRVLACIRTNSVGYARSGVFSRVIGVSLGRMCRCV
jgi:hypothetical protein